MLQVDTILGWQGAINAIIESMRDAGTHVRTTMIEAPIEATQSLGALAICGQTVWIHPS
jgi:hypothetical protein